MQPGDRPRPGRVHPGQRRGPDPGHHRLRCEVRRPDLSRRPRFRSGWRRARCSSPATSASRSTPSSRTSSACSIRSTPPSSTRILSALAEGVRGQGERIGQATTDANQVLLALNPRSETIRADWQALKGFSDAYGGAATNIVNILDALSTTSVTITNNAKPLDALLLNVIGFSNSGIALLAPNQQNLIKAINVLEPTTNLLMKYNPEYTCMLVGAKWLLDNGGYDASGGNGKSFLVDGGILAGDDQYRYPQNLPITGAKGGPGGKPGCGSLPIVDQQLAGAPADHQHRLGHRRRHPAQPGHRLPWLRELPSGDPRGARAAEHPQPVRRARARPERRLPAGGHPGAGRLPYGAPMYNPDGTPIWNNLPPAPPPGAPRDPGATPGSEPFVVPFPGQHADPAATATRYPYRRRHRRDPERPVPTTDYVHREVTRSERQPGRRHLALGHLRDGLPAGYVCAVCDVRAVAFREGTGLPGPLRQRDRPGERRLRPHRRCRGRQGPEDQRQRRRHRDGRLHRRRHRGADRGLPGRHPLRRPDRWPLPGTRRGRRRHQEAQPGRHHPAGPDRTGAGPRRADRWLPAAVPCAEPRPGQPAVRAADQRPAGPGRHHLVVPVADRRTDQHAGRPRSADRRGDRQPEHGAGFACRTK